MTRLIDADTLSDIFETKVCRGCSSECVTDEYGCGCSIHYMKELLWQQPTAYDVEKVVEALNTNIEFYEDVADNDYEDGRYHAYEDALDIVKRGGVDD